jgi:hypothetical protein
MIMNTFYACLRAQTTEKAAKTFGHCLGGVGHFFGHCFPTKRKLSDPQNKSLIHLIAAAVHPCPVLKELAFLQQCRNRQLMCWCSDS